MSNIGTAGDPRRSDRNGTRLDELRSPLKRARGLGSGKSGTGHWWWQRLTAVALVLLMAPGLALLTVLPLLIFDRDLPKDVRHLTLAYTLFDITARQPPAPLAGR